MSTEEIPLNKHTKKINILTNKFSNLYLINNKEFSKLYTILNKAFSVSVLLFFLFPLITSSRVRAASNTQKEIPVILTDKKSTGNDLQNTSPVLIVSIKNPAAEIIKYQIIPGDTLSIIADKYKDNKATVDSLKWSNNLDSDLIIAGNELLISPVEGVIHKAAKDEDLVSIAKKYKKISDTSTEDQIKSVEDELIDTNGLEVKIINGKRTVDISEGKNLIIPGAFIPEKVITALSVQQPLQLAKKSPIIPVVQNQTKTINITQSIPSSSSGLIWPVMGGLGTVSRGIEIGHNGVDIWSFAAPLEIATGSGTVISTAWSNYGGGYEIRIKLDNGFTAVYAHTAGDFRVSPGQHISAGQALATMSNTGNATGVHLHFELWDANGSLLNPLNYVSR